MRFKEFLNETGETVGNNTFTIAKKFNQEFRDLAASVDITMADMPSFLKGGVWYGGTLTPKGGKKGEDTHLLPFGSRAKLFLKQLGNILVEKASEGKMVFVVANQNKVANSKTLVPMKPEEIRRELSRVDIKLGVETNHLVDRINLKWYIGFSEEESSLKFIRIIGGVTIKMPNSVYARASFDIAADVSADEFQDLKKKLTVAGTKSSIRTRSTNGYAIFPILFRMYFANGGKTAEHLDMTIDKQLKAINKSILDEQYSYLYVRGGVMAKSTVMVSAQELISAVDAWAGS